MDQQVLTRGPPPHPRRPEGGDFRTDVLFLRWRGSVRPSMGGLGGRGTPDPRASPLWPPAWCWLPCPETLPSATALAGWGLGVTFALYFMRRIQISYNQNVLPFRLKYMYTYIYFRPDCPRRLSWHGGRSPRLKTCRQRAGHRGLSPFPLHLNAGSVGSGSRDVPTPRGDFWKGLGVAP